MQYVFRINLRGEHGNIWGWEILRHSEVWKNGGSLFREQEKAMNYFLRDVRKR